MIMNDGLLGEDTEEPRLPQPLLDLIAAKTGEETTVETLMGVPQKQVSLKIDLFNRSLLLLHFSERQERDCQDGFFGPASCGELAICCSFPGSRSPPSFL